jgi:hypothetical protein
MPPNTARPNVMADYIPVADRIGAFYDKHPEGSIQSEMVELTDSRVVMRAYAYRTPDDPRPGIGYSSMNIPGSTSFTRGSEVENCETSAWGRAIAALGFEVKRGIATAEEVRNKQEERRPTPIRQPATMPDEPTDEELAELHGEIADAPWDYAAFRAACKAMAGPKPDLKDVVTNGAKLFPTKGLELYEPKAWKLTDQEWRQLAAVLGAIPA